MRIYFFYLYMCRFLVLFSSFNNYFVLHLKKKIKEEKRKKFINIIVTLLMNK
jgi:hypothetical protein